MEWDAMLLFIHVILYTGTRMRNHVARDALLFMTLKPCRNMPSGGAPDQTRPQQRLYPQQHYDDVTLPHLKAGDVGHADKSHIMRGRYAICRSGIPSQCMARPSSVHVKESQCMHFPPVQLSTLVNYASDRRDAHEAAAVTYTHAYVLIPNGSVAHTTHLLVDARLAMTRLTHTLKPPLTGPQQRQ